MTDSSSDNPGKKGESTQKPGAYVPASPGDPILAQDWNEMQLAIRKHITTHSHTGSTDQGLRLTGEAIDPGSTLSVKALHAETLALTQGGVKRFSLSTEGKLEFGSGALTIHQNGELHLGQTTVLWSKQHKRSILTFDRYMQDPDGAFYEVGNWMDDWFRFRRVWGGKTIDFRHRDDLLISPAGRVCVRNNPVVVGTPKQGPNQRIVAGTIAADGSKLRGEGFTCERFAEGRYSVRFEEPFTTPPIIIATAQGYNNDDHRGEGAMDCYTSIWVAQVKHDLFSCVTGRRHTTNYSASDRRFHFIAIGNLADG